MVEVSRESLQEYWTVKMDKDGKEYIFGVSYVEGHVVDDGYNIERVEIDGVEEEGDVDEELTEEAIELVEKERERRGNL
jgi:hypothetical protein